MAYFQGRTVSFRECINDTKNQSNSGRYTPKKKHFEPKNWWFGSMFLLFRSVGISRFKQLDFRGCKFQKKLVEQFGLKLWDHFMSFWGNGAFSHDGSMGEWYIYLHGWWIFIVVNVGKYTIHWSYGLWFEISYHQLFLHFLRSVCSVLITQELEFSLIPKPKYWTFWQYLGLVLEKKVLHHPLHTKRLSKLDILHINWCRISFISDFSHCQFDDFQEKFHCWSSEEFEHNETFIPGRPVVIGKD